MVEEVVFAASIFRIRNMSQTCSDCAEQYEYLIAGITMIIIGVIGCTINITAIILIFRTVVFHSSFGCICASHLVADTGVLVIHILWAGPATILELSPDATTSYLGARIGQLALLFWLATLYSQLQIAINRLVAIAWPTKYEAIFSGKWLVLFTSANWILSGLQSFLHFWEECTYYFESDVFSWSYSKTDCGKFSAFYLDFLPSTAACALIFLLHTTTFFCLRKKTKAKDYGVFLLNALILHLENIRPSATNTPSMPE
ncbi:hypothetical protein RB195_005356 [Necator americanus]|uniref:G-protein coupled receptors family 1 profile domain-containing protein n=1 Tax=Necator americanus TaxID=51031 RepID=A0ABR1BP01_NECAM